MPSSPDEQSQLHGAYYGSIPPKESKTYRRPGRGIAGSCLCYCCECLGFCAFPLILQMVLTIFFILSFLAFLFWIVFCPSLVMFHVTGAELTQFNLSSSTNVLNYGLSVNVTVRNPNRRIGIYYDSIEVSPFYQGLRLDSQYLPPFYQGHKNTTYISGVFQGQVLLFSDALIAYQTNNADGPFEIDVKVYLRVRFKLAWFKTSKFKPRVECGLNVPFNSTADGVFETTKCHFRVYDCLDRI